MTDNELIAEFMGIRKVHTGIYDHPIDGIIGSSQLHYRDSWDWLMPVVEKISKHIYESTPDSNGYKEIIHHERAYMRTFGMIDNEGRWMVRINRMPLEQDYTLIEATYKAVVEFIKSVSKT